MDNDDFEHGQWVKLSGAKVIRPIDGASTYKQTELVQYSEKRRWTTWWLNRACATVCVEEFGSQPHKLVAWEIDLGKKPKWQKGLATPLKLQGLAGNRIK